jgi:hypothetical protein
MAALSGPNPKAPGFATALPGILTAASGSAEVIVDHFDISPSHGLGS